VADHTLRPLGVQVRIETSGLENRLPGEIETILFRIAQEAMNNVARHSEAETLIIQLVRTDGHVRMTLQDDGRGFDPQTVIPSLELSRGWGLAGMQERASLAGGQVHVISVPGQGTTIRVEVPAPTTPV
jgi:signal transduction histidine kinase